MKLTLSALAELLAIPCPVPAELWCDGVATDTRQPMPAALFVALRGERFDAHDFVVQAQAQGAAAALVATDYVPPAEVSLPLLRVADTRLALGVLARGWRRQFSLPLIGVTGSNGKTTLKDMCAAILRQAHGEAAVLATQGNLNNDIGVPMMLLRLSAAHRAAVIEMGMNHPGEIAYLAGLAEPTVAVVNNAQRAHLAGMGDLTAVAREKGSLLGGLCAAGTAILNADQPFVDLWRSQAGERTVLTFGLQDADVGVLRQPGGALRNAAGVFTLRTPAGQAEVALQVPGEHNVANALAAAAACLAAGLSLTDIAAGLSAFGGTPGRLQARRAACGARVLDDTYNANPDSVRAGIRVLAAESGDRVLVLGDMGEVGETGPAMHAEMGAYAREQGITTLLALGPQMAQAVAAFGPGGEHFTDVDGLLARLSQRVQRDSVVLVKGSRFMRMERITNALCAPAPLP